jgi:hypothetical protein
MVNADTASIIATLSFNGYVGIACFAVFEYFRRKETEIYAPRKRSTLQTVEVPTPSDSILGWIGQVYHISDEYILKNVGLDGYVFLRYLRMCSMIGGICSIVGGLVLIPVYFTAPGEEGVSNVALYSMANIHAGGERLWASFAAAYAFTLVFLYLIYKEYENFASARLKVLTDGDVGIPPQVGYAVIVENIPKEYRSSGKLKAFFETIFPGDIECANICLVTDVLSAACDERKAVINQLECAVAAFEAAPEKPRPLLKLRQGKATMCCAEQKVDAIDFTLDQLSVLNEEVRNLQSDASFVEQGDTSNGRGVGDAEDGRSSNSAETTDASVEAAGVSSQQKRRELSTASYKPRIDEKNLTSTGFVTFKTRRAQAVACQIAVISAAYPKMIVSPAPEPNEILWKNIGVTPARSENMAYFTSLGFYYGLFFWGSILAFISALSNLSNLEPFLPFLSYLDASTYALLQGLLPVIMLIVFLMYLPVIIGNIITLVEGRKSKCVVQIEVFGW